MSEQKPTAIIILGGAGDLAQRKLLPSLFTLYINHGLPKDFSLIALARTPRTNTQYRQLVSEAIKANGGHLDRKALKAFCTRCTYVAGSFDDQESYTKLRTAIELQTRKPFKETNRLFYLAIPPAHYAAVCTALHTSALAQEPARKPVSWSRILIEKPFGNTLASARKLDALLNSLFEDDQIFRIDHYLAKEAVLNLLSFRFANPLIQSAWSAKYIQEVRITLSEKQGVYSRGAFYDEVGALRDVGQNHLLQLLALLAMEEPESFTAEDIRRARASILSKLVPLNKKMITDSVVRAQYAGYKKTPHVHRHSQTETYFECKVHLNTPRWRNVPFYIKAGKGLGKDEVSVEIIFNDTPEGVFGAHKNLLAQNRILLRIAPNPTTVITLNTKKTGYDYLLEQHTLSFMEDTGSEREIGAYEKVLLDCIRGDQTLFTKTEEVVASWKFIASVMDNWHQVPLQTYRQGSNGPKQTLFTTTKS